MATTYTDQQILDQAREALFNILAGSQSYSIAGRTMTKADLGKIQDIIDMYEARVEASTSDAGIGGATLLARFRDAT